MPKNTTQGNQPAGSSNPVLAREHSEYGRRLARRRKMKKAWIILASSALGGILVLSIIAYLGRVSNAFTISIDPRTAQNTIVFKQSPNSPTGTDETTYLTAEGMQNSWQTGADSVFAHAATLYPETNYSPDRNPLIGSHNYKDQQFIEGVEGPVVVDKALFYTFYLSNASDGAIDYSFNMKLENYVSPSNNAQEPYTYLRVALFENTFIREVGATQTHNYTVYALSNYEYKNGAGDYREPISAWVPRTDAEGNITHVAAGNVTPELNDYAVPFIANREFFDRSGNLQQGEIKRYTIAIWIEGNDPDCYGRSPEGVTMTFGLYFSAI